MRTFEKGTANMPFLFQMSKEEVLSEDEKDLSLWKLEDEQRD